MLDSQCEGYIFEFWERFVLSLKMHCPNIRQWAKGFNQLGVVLNKMMLWFQSKTRECWLWIVNILIFKKSMDSSVCFNATANSTIYLRSISISHEVSPLSPIERGRSLSKIQFSWPLPLPPIVPLVAKAFAYTFSDKTDRLQQITKFLTVWFTAFQRWLKRNTSFSSQRHNAF